MKSEITLVSVTVLADNPKAKADVTIELNGDFIIRHLRLVEGESGLYVAYPGQWDNSPSCHPTTHELREAIEQAVIAKYNTMCRPVAEVLAEYGKAVLDGRMSRTRAERELEGLGSVLDVATALAQGK